MIDRYEIALDFVVDGVSYNVTMHEKCDLTSTAREDTACMATLRDKYIDADKSCYVDKRLLPDCNASTCISYSAPEWNIGCWVCCMLAPPARSRSWSHYQLLIAVCFSARVLILAFGLVLVLANSLCLLDSCY